MQRILHEWGPLFVARRILLPALGYALLLAASAAINSGDTGWFLVLGITQILFLFTGTYNAWDLLIRVGKS